MRRAIVVLIVDDDADHRDLCAEFLEGRGMRVICAENGAIGIEKAREVVPELIVMDLEMPVMGGLEALEELQQDKRTHDIPVVVLSGDAIVQHAEATRLGCSASLSKPCRPEDLENVIVALVENRRLARSATR